MPEPPVNVVSSAIMLVTGLVILFAIHSPSCTSCKECCVSFPDSLVRTGAWIRATQENISIATAVNLVCTEYCSGVFFRILMC